MKKRVVLGILGFSAAFCCISLGYAAWTITGSMSGKVDGNFEAYDLTDNGDLSVELCDSTGNTVASETIVYGKPSAATSFNEEDIWFTFTDSMKTENLDAYVKLTYTKLTDFDAAGTSFSVDSDLQSRTKTGNTTYSEYVDNTTQTFISDPVIEVVSSTDNLITYSNNVVNFKASGSIVLKVTYNWNLPNGANPYNYYNSQDVDDTIRTNAANYINGLYQLVGENNDLLRFVINVDEA